MSKRLRTFSVRPRRVFAASLGLALTAGLTLVSCSGNTLGGFADEDMGISSSCVVTSLSISPDNDVLQVDLNQPQVMGQKTFTVRALCSDGTSGDVTNQATLTLDNQAVGALTGNTFTSVSNTATKVDFTRVTAALNNNGQVINGVANLTVVWLRTSGASTDFFFQSPYLSPAQVQPLSFSTNVQSLDSFFAVDTTASMGPEISQLSSSLQGAIIPGVKAAAAKDAQFGVGAVEDFGVNPYGVAGALAGNVDDQPLIMLQNMTADVAAAQTAVGKLLNGAVPRGNGNDVPEGQMEALYQLATGVGNVVAGAVNIPANQTGIGGAGFRKGALPVITMITDAMFHTKNEAAQQCTVSLSGGGTQTIRGDYAGTVANVAHDRTATLAALNSICAKVIGVSALRATIPNVISDPRGICNATADLVQMANGTGAAVPPVAWDIPSRPGNCAAGMCCTGMGGAGEAPQANGLCPLVFKIPQDGTGLGAQVTSGIANVARFASFTVTTQTSGVTTGDKGEQLPAGKTTADFITMINPARALAPAAPPVLPVPVITGGAFTTVYPGSTVSFTVSSQNNLVPETTTPQVFRATIKVLAGGCADLDQREVIILVPPKAPVIG